MDRARSELGALPQDSLSAHVRSVEARASRDAEVLRHASPSIPAQPGLFDRRSDDARPRDDAAGTIRAEISRGITQLRTSAALEEHIEVRGLLIVWDRTE